MTPIGRMKEQMQWIVQVLEVQDEELRQAKEKGGEFGDGLRGKPKSIHFNANARILDSVTDLATEDVEVGENGNISRGKQAFVDLVTAQNADRDAFLNKLFHDFDVLVDGNVGAVGFVWQAPQEKYYERFEVKEGVLARMRGVLFFEFDEDKRDVKATDIYDEHVVSATLGGTGGYLYP